ncbi:MAG TPA: NUDIX domain-containing protein [Micromonosporaceae bacterium]|nr:NUDIX domain-containing protein [Micromonosporaceae bacterium]
MLEATARREVREEIGVALDDVPLFYADSAFFFAADGDQVINVVFVAQFPDDGRPTVASPDEVSEIVRLTVSEAEADRTCPPWTRRSLAQS